MKLLKKWWPAALALIAVVVVGVIFLLRDGAAADESALVGSYTIATSNLVASISPTGEVYAPRQSDLIFEVSEATELVEVNIAPGQKVTQGELLARIDDEALSRAVTQAQADLTLAKAGLQDAQNPYTNLDLVQAKVDVEQTQAALQEAQQNLADALEPLTDLDLADAQLSVEQAKTNYELAVKALSDAQASDVLKLKSAQVTMAQAQTSLAEARDTYSDVIDGPSVADLAAAEADYLTANDTYQALLAGPDQDAIDTAKQSLDKAKNSLWSAQSSRDSTCGNPNGSAAQCNSANAGVWNQEISVQQAEKAYADAQEPPTAAEIASALAQMEQAKDSWQALKNSPTALDTAKAAASVSQAEYNLAVAEETLAESTAGANALDLAELRTSVSQANYNVAIAEEALTELQSGKDAIEIAKLQTAVAQAEYNLAKAQQTQAEIEAGPDPDDIEVAQAKLLSAQATLDEAQQALQDATMEAPFDGTIISVSRQKGDKVASNTVFAVIADLTTLEVLASVDETDITQVEIGQLVQITFDSFPGAKFVGQVLEVPLQGTLSGSIMIYEVPISLEGTDDLALKSGMTANCTVVLGRRENVLLVPTMAIQLTDEGNVVLLDDGSEAGVTVPIQTGLTDGLFTEVLSGLNAGDVVKVKYSTTDSSNAFGFSGMRELAGSGGGMAVGGGGPPAP